MIINKYRVGEVAKDFGLKNVNIAALLSKYFDGRKTYMTVLEEDELDVIFELFTLQNETEDLDGYFNLVPESKKGERVSEKAREEKPKKKPEEKPAEKPEEKPAEKPEEKPAEKPEEKPAEKPEERPAEKPAGKSDEKPERKPVGKPSKAKKEVKAEKRPEKRTLSSLGKTFFKFDKKQETEEAKPSKPAQSRIRGAARTVNTRTDNVNLDKYNEKYENIASASKTQKQNDSVSKQKIKQKSKQYRRRGGTRSIRRETEAERLNRIAAERAKKPRLRLKLPEEISVGELAAMLKRTAAEVIKKLSALGQTAAINETLDYETAAILAEELGAKVEKEVVITIEDRIIDDSEDEEKDLIPRDPVVVVMGHVDHGKTSLLDAVRHTSVVSGEAGGITQRIGAYRAEVNGSKITFLDTPGHAAFTAMRLRGAMATDVAVLVVAADDGVMPQTIEAINHAKAAGVQIIAAINKIDKPDANVDKILQQLAERGLVPESWGGETVCVPVSARTGEGLDKLLEAVLLVAELQELKANPNRSAKGVVVEARLDRGKGPVATLLVQNGTLKTGDIVVAGAAVGKVRVMTDDKGKRTDKAGPSTPVEITGLTEVPQAGDGFDAVKDEKLARELVEQRKNKAKEEQFKERRRATLDNPFDAVPDGSLKGLNLVIKADVQGSAEATRQSLVNLSNDEVKVKVIHDGVGAINESDVMLAKASDAVIIGFSVKPEASAADMAERDGVEIRLYNVIYECIEDMEAAVKGMLAPKRRDVDIGKAEIRRVIRISSVGVVAGCRVISGKITRDSKIRVVRDGVVAAQDEIVSLRRFKDDVKEAVAGFDCGVGLKKFNDIKEGDVLEAYVSEEYRD